MEHLLVEIDMSWRHPRRLTDQLLYPHICPTFLSGGLCELPFILLSIEYKLTFSLSLPL